MRWTIILLMSMVGVLVGVLNIFGVLSGVGWWVWILLWVLMAVVLGKQVPGKYFMHGFLVGILSGVINSLLTYFFYDTYAANSPQFAEAAAKMPPGYDFRAMMLYTLPVNAAIGGVVMGLLTMLAGKIFGTKPEEKKPEEISTTPPTQ
jgi:hypothetical protein